MSWFSSGAKRIAEVIEKLAATSEKLDHFDKEVHRMLEEFKRLLGAMEARQQRLDDNNQHYLREIAELSARLTHLREENGVLRARSDRAEARIDSLIRDFAELKADFKAALTHATVITAREGAVEGARQAMEKAIQAKQVKGNSDPRLAVVNISSGELDEGNT
jgi:chromosome segregation ATPase